MYLFRSTEINNQPVNLNNGDNNNPYCSDDLVYLVSNSLVIILHMVIIFFL